MLSNLLKQTGSDLAFIMLEIGALPLGTKPEPFHALLEPWPRSKVVAFEVDPALCAELNEKAPAGIHYYPNAIGRSSGTRIFYETDHPMCGSLYPPDERYADVFHNLDVMRLKKLGTIDTVSLDEFVQEQAIGLVDFIKMDIQGAELEVLQGAVQVLKDVLLIVCEVEFVPLYTSQPLFGDVDAFLRSHGFTFHKFLGLAGRAAKPLVLNNNLNQASQQMWADAIFIRDPFHLEALSSEQLQKLGILLELYDSPDFAHFLLSAWDKREGARLSESYLQALTRPPVLKEEKALPARTVLTFADGVRIVVPDSLDLITTYVLQEQQDWFEDEIKFVRRLLQPGQKAIDIGANYGVYTLSMAQLVGPEGHIWAFEPATTTANHLRESIAENHFLHVTLEQCALSDTCGSARLGLNNNSELNSLVHGEDSPGASEVVDLVTLDACMEVHDWDHVDFLKMDAEGEESNILKGGRQFFDRLSPLVLYEIKAGADLHMELEREFAALGYESYRLIPGLDLLVPFDGGTTPDDYLLNLFCCKRDRANQLASRGHLLQADTPGAGIQMDSPEATYFMDAFSWRQTIAHLPYGLQLASSWEKSMAEGNGVGVQEALACYAMSRESSLPAGHRFAALERSFNLLKALCEHQPSHLRLASLVRVARDFGQRSCAVAALKRFIDMLLNQHQLDFGEPFLAPAPRFDLVPPGPSIDNWIRAAVLEEFERLGAYSSFYTGTSSLKRLEHIHHLGFGSEEMERRLSLVRTRFGLLEEKGPALLPSPFHPFSPSVELTKSRYGLMLYPPKDPYLGRSLKEYGQVNQGELDLFTQFISAGAIVIDIGANIGVHTVPLAQLVGPGGVVVAFEPRPDLYKILGANLVLNSIPNVLTYGMALGIGEGEGQISSQDDTPAGQSEEVTGVSVEDGESVPMGKLDDFQLDHVDLIRLDVGGFASKVLEGAVKTIERCRPMMYIKNDREELPSHLIQQLFDMGYSLWWHTPRLFSPGNFKGNAVDVFPGIVSINMLAIHRNMRPIEGLKPILAAEDTWR